MSTGGTPLGDDGPVYRAMAQTIAVGAHYALVPSRMGSGRCLPMLKAMVAAAGRCGHAQVITHAGGTEECFISWCLLAPAHDGPCPAPLQEAAALAAQVDPHRRLARRAEFARARLERLALAMPPA